MMKNIRVLVALTLVALLGTACDTTGSPASATDGPHTWIDAPQDGSAISLSLMEVVSHSADLLHIVQVELSVNGAVVQTSPNSDAGATLVTTKQAWTPPSPGNYTLMVRAQNSAGVWGDYTQAIVTVGGAGVGGIVQGVVYADLNGNGTVESGEGPLDGVAVSLNGCGPAMAQTTGADGKFFFDKLPAGSCLVQVAKGGWGFSGSFPKLSYPIPVASDPSKPTAFSIFMAPSGPTSTPTAATKPGISLPPVGIAFYADATTLVQGQCTTIHWQVTNASKVVLDGAVVAAVGSKQVCPNQTATHSLNVTTLDNQQASRTLTINVVPPGRTPTPSPVPISPTPVPAPQVQFWADSTSINSGQCTFLHWRTEYVQGVYLNGSPVVGDQDLQVCPPTSTTFTLHVVYAGGSTDRQVVIRVAVLVPTSTPTLVLRTLPTPTRTRTPIIIK